MIRRTRAHVARRSPFRGGFTLLEVVIALALSLVLLTALTLALDLFRRVSTISTEEIERGQLARAIFRKMELDLRSCTYRPPDAAAPGSTSASSSGSGTGTGSGSGTSQASTAATIDPAAAYAGSSTGVVGDSGSLVIQSVRPARNLASLIDPAVAETAVPDSDLRSIVYFLSLGGAEGLAGAAAQGLAGPATGDGTGLARLDGDQLSMQFADVTADVATMASGATLLAKEVTVLQFQYFDGIAWYDVWDTSANRRLPNAVAITIGFGEAPLASDETATGPARPPVNAAYVFRHIVALPAAEPPVLASGAAPL